MSTSRANVERRERLRKLALETVDLAKDPYILKNHLGSYECKLCLTLHPNEGSYLAHTQGKKHQTNLGRRAAKLAKDVPGIGGVLGSSSFVKPTTKVKKVTIGLPEHYVFKIRHPNTKQLGLLFVLKYPKIKEGKQPRIRFMSSVEQHIEPADLHFQYLLFAAEPYHVCSFKIPNLTIDRSEDKFLQNWNPNTRVFVFQLHFSK